MALLAVNVFFGWGYVATHTSGGVLEYSLEVRSYFSLSVIYIYIYIYVS